MRSVFPIVITMFAYAIALVFMGLLTFVARPLEVSKLSAATSILIPSVGAILIVVCAVVTARINSNVRNARVAVYAALVVALLMIVGPAARLPASLQQNRQYHEAQAEDAPPALAEAAPAFPKGYQAVGLGGIATLSFFALLAMAGEMPKWSKFRAAAALRAAKTASKASEAGRTSGSAKPAPTPAPSAASEPASDQPAAKSD